MGYVSFREGKLPKTDSSISSPPWKMVAKGRRSLSFLRRVIFRGHVSFREGPVLLHLHVSQVKFKYLIRRDWSSKNLQKLIREMHQLRVSPKPRSWKYNPQISWNIRTSHQTSANIIKSPQNIFKLSTNSIKSPNWLVYTSGPHSSNGQPKICGSNFHLQVALLWPLGR